MGRGLLASVLTLTVVLSVPRPSFGQEADRDRAIELYQASQESYAGGRFEEAAVYLEEAYRLDPAPILLYNLARARESAGDTELALEAYRRYLDETPEADDRAAVEARIAALERQLEERAQLEQMVERERKAKEAAAKEAEAARLAAEAQARAAIERSSGPSPVPFVVTGVGIAGVGAGVVLGILAADRHDSATAAPIQADAADLSEEADGLATGANIAYAAGGVVAAAGLVWAIIELSGGDEPAKTVLVPTLSPDGLGVAGTF